MPKETNAVSTLSRRGFLGAGAVAMAGGVVASCQSGVETTPTLRRPRGPEDEAWRSVSSQFNTDSGVVYLNNASLGMPPTVVADAVGRGYHALSSDPIHAKHQLSDEVADHVRPGLARFLGAEPSEIALTRNATEALHLAAVGAVLDPGDEVLITTQEHPAGQRPWAFLKATAGVRVREVFVPSPLESEEHVEQLLFEQVTPRTKAMAFCHVTRGGHRYPVKAICRRAEERGILTIVDGAQAVGMFPVDMQDLGCDAYAASLHKWLLGPMGTGVLYVRNGSRPRLLSAYEAGVDGVHEPAGTADLPVKAGIGAALEFIESIGIETIEARDRFLSDYLKSRLEAIPSVRLLSGSTVATSAPGSTIFEMGGLDAMASVAPMADMYGLHIDEHVRDGHDAIRISTHFYNSPEQIDRAVDALQNLAAV